MHITLVVMKKDIQPVLPHSTVRYTVDVLHITLVVMKKDIQPVLPHSTVRYTVDVHYFSSYEEGYPTCIAPFYCKIYCWCTLL